MEEVYIGPGSIDRKGVYAARDFKKGEVVLHYSLTRLSSEEYDALPHGERDYVHTHWGGRYLYDVPERYVNHSADPNTLQDLVNRCDVALRDIQKGELITTDAGRDDI